MIIDEAVKQFKNGNIKNSMDVENFIDGLLQPLMQKLLDTELDNHLEYSKYEHIQKTRKLIIVEMVIVKLNKLKLSMVVLLLKPLEIGMVVLIQ